MRREIVILMFQQRGFAPILIIVAVAAVVGLTTVTYYLGIRTGESKSVPQVPLAVETSVSPPPTSTQKTNDLPSPSSLPITNTNPVTKAISSPSSVPKVIASPTISIVNGAGLGEIKYNLPQGWEAKLNEDSLFISPIHEGGYLSIKIYNYPGTSGRREFYCQVSTVCIQGTTYFTEMAIGNISGYSANALDNSGGGTEYFGAKGNKFYIISSFSPSSPTPNEFDKNRSKVLESLVF